MFLTKSKMSVLTFLLILIALPRRSNLHDSFEEQQPSFTTMYYNPLQPYPSTVSSPFLSFIATTSSSSTRTLVAATTSSPFPPVTATASSHRPSVTSTASNPLLSATATSSSRRSSVTTTASSAIPSVIASTHLLSVTATATSPQSSVTATVASYMPCDVNSWSPWSFCNAPCGFGRQTREAIFETPDCDPFVQERQCEADMPCQRDDPAGSTPGQDIVADSNETEANSTEVSFVAIFEEFCQNISSSSFPVSNGEYAHNDTEFYFTHAVRSLLCFLAGFADNLFRSPPYFSSRRKMFQLMKRVNSGKFSKQTGKQQKKTAQNNRGKHNKKPSTIKGTASALKKRNIKGRAEKKSVGGAGKRQKLSPKVAGGKAKGKLSGSSKQKVFPKSGPKFGTSPKNSAAAGSRPNQNSKFGGGSAPKKGQGSVGLGGKQSSAQAGAKQKPKSAKPSSGIGSKQPGKLPTGSKPKRPNQMGGSGSPRNKLGLGGLGRPINILKSGNKTQN